MEERSTEVEKGRPFIIIITTIVKIIIIKIIITIIITKIIIIIKMFITIIIMMTSLKRVEERSSEVEEGRLPATAATSTRSLWILSISKRLLIHYTAYRA